MKGNIILSSLFLATILALAIFWAPRASAEPDEDILGSAYSAEPRHSNSSPGVAKILGVREGAVAEAIDVGASRTYERPAIRLPAEKSVDESRFLLNSTGVDADSAQLRNKQAYWPKSRKQREDEVKKAQQNAVEMLQFRQNIEQAMSQILAFQPSQVVVGEQNGGGAHEALVRDIEKPAAPVRIPCKARLNAETPQERLLFSVCRE